MTTVTMDRSAVTEETYGGLRIERDVRTNMLGTTTFYAKVWMGKAKTPAYYGFRHEASREKYIAERKAGWDAAQAYKQARADARKAFDATEHFKVGDILYASWGYDQTNVDFYEVLAVTRGMVTIEAIGQQTNETLHSMAENVVPNPAHRTGRITKHRATSTSLHVTTCSYASLWNGTPKYQSHYA